MLPGGQSGAAPMPGGPPGTAPLPGSTAPGSVADNTPPAPGTPGSLPLAATLGEATAMAEDAASSLFMKEASRRAQELAQTLRTAATNQAGLSPGEDRASSATDFARGNWAKLRGSIRSQTARPATRRAPAEYREQIDLYFEDLAKGEAP